MLALLLLSVFYTGLAIADLNFMGARGRIGPGFFPQIIGVLLVAFTLYSTWLEFRRRETDEPLAPEWRVTAGVAAMSAVLVVGSYWLGALPGMIVFMLLSLSVLNRGNHVTNLLVGLLLPIGIFSLFRYSLNATMPPGTLGLPL